MVCQYAVPNYSSGPSIPLSGMLSREQMERIVRPMLTASHRTWPTCPLGRGELTIQYGLCFDSVRRARFAACFVCQPCAARAASSVL